MGNGRRRDVKRHLDDAELSEQIRSERNPEMVRRLGFIKNLYQGDTITEAAEREGKSQPTGGRWLDRWNEGGRAALEPDHGGGRPPKLDEDDRDELRRLLNADGPWTIQEIRERIETEFAVEYHPTYVYELIRDFEMNVEKP